MLDTTPVGAGHRCDWLGQGPGAPQLGPEAVRVSELDTQAGRPWPRSCQTAPRPVEAVRPLPSTATATAGCVCHPRAGCGGGTDGGWASGSGGGVLTPRGAGRSPTAARRGWPRASTCCSSSKYGDYCQQVFLSPASFRCGDLRHRPTCLEGRVARGSCWPAGGHDRQGNRRHPVDPCRDDPMTPDSFTAGRGAVRGRGSRRDGPPRGPAASPAGGQQPAVNTSSETASHMIFRSDPRGNDPVDVPHAVPMNTDRVPPCRAAAAGASCAPAAYQARP